MKRATIGALVLASAVGGAVIDRIVSPLFSPKGTIELNEPTIMLGRDIPYEIEIPASGRKVQLRYEGEMQQDIVRLSSNGKLLAVKKGESYSIGSSGSRSVEIQALDTIADKGYSDYWLRLQISGVDLPYKLSWHEP